MGCETDEKGWRDSFPGSDRGYHSRCMACESWPRLELVVGWLEAVLVTGSKAV